MVYLSTTQYLSRKLNWMGRKLRFMNDATTIKEWTEAMDCVFKSLDTFSRNKDVSTPTQIWIKKMEIHRGQNINVLSLHVDSKIKEKVVKKAKRITVKKKRKLSIREINSSKPEQAGSMEVDGDVSRSRPPRVEVEGDDVDMCDPKAAVMKMLREAKEWPEKSRPITQRRTNEDLTELASDMGNKMISTEWESWRIGANTDSEEDRWYLNQHTGASCWERPTTKKIPFKGYRSFPR